MSLNRVQFTSTTAEVAEAKSNLPDWRVPAGERCFRRRICLTPSREILGLHRICAELSSYGECDVVLPGPDLVFAPRACLHGDFELLRGNDHEKDTLYHIGKGIGDP